MAVPCRTGVVLVVLLACLTMGSYGVAAGRELLQHMHTGFEVEEEGGGGGGLMECWHALTEIKSCSDEIVVFFLEGMTDIGPACCKAISTITHHCWPSMLTTLGFTPEETSLLRGYCDAASSSSSAPTSSP
ncbi:hypothetical protein NMG60_11007147 [Bertholletia excelsa]